MFYGITMFILIFFITRMKITIITTKFFGVFWG